jgi:quinol monooxygenase YgiN
MYHRWKIRRSICWPNRLFCLDSWKRLRPFSRRLFPPTLQEPGCEALYETGREDDPHKLVFFEIFSSAEAHEFHLQQDYTKRMFAALDGKLSGVPTMTILSAL